MFQADYDHSEIWIYDEIGPAWWGLIDSASVIGALSEMEGKRVTVRLNTPGGSVDEGVAIYNAMKRHPGGVDTVVDSLAASMGSYLLQAGQTRTVAENAMVMIHDPWSIAIGNSSEFRKEADILDKYAGRMVPDYAKATGQSEDEIRALMADETWLAGQEIVDAGFADVVADHVGDDEPEPQVASLHRICRKLPPEMAAKFLRKKDKPSNKSSRVAAPKREAARAIAASIRR